MTIDAALGTVTRAAVLTTLLVLSVTARAAAVDSKNDASITTRVKLSLLTSEGLRGNQVNVDTVGRAVTLHGIVGSIAEKDAAERIARSVEGVEGVRNLLEVVAAAAISDREEAGIEARDERVREVVAAALAAEPSLESSGVSVQSVHHGVVVLGGTARDLGAHLTAVELARDVEGVRRVASEIRNESELADSSMWKNPYSATDGDVGTIRGAAKDLYTTSMVKVRLLADAQIPALHINVDTRNGNVTLFGIVPTEESKHAAESQARKAGGVESVKNKLQVVAAAEQPIVKANDDVVAANVRRSLGRYSNMGRVDVEVRNCVVRLTGTVPSGVERVEALQVTRATAGVCGVEDGLMIR